MPSPTPKPIYFNKPQRLTQLIGANISVIVEFPLQSPRATVLSIKPIPNLQDKIHSLIDKCRKKTIDIEDIEWEEADLEEDTLFHEDKKEEEP